MEMKLMTTLAIIATLLMHHLPLSITSTADHRTLDNSSSTGFSFPIVTDHTFDLGTDGFLHLKNNLQADMLLSLGDSSLVENITTLGTEIMSIIKVPIRMVVDVGTGRGQQRYVLKVSTASILTWIQCHPCNPKVSQQGPIFQPDESPTCVMVSGTDPICDPPYTPMYNGTRCMFVVAGPPDNAAATGYLARDHFAKEGNVFPAFQFGCSHSTVHFQSQGVYAGIISVGRAPTSLVMQLAAHGLTHFSYCLSGGIEANRQGFLRFGSDVPLNHQHYRSTRILQSLHAFESEYFVSLVGLSLGAQRLNKIRPEMFARRSDGQGGCVIDLGTPLTVLVMEAYQVVEEALWSDLKYHGAERVKQSGFGLCVRATKAVKGHLQSLSLHFLEEEAVMALSPAQLFLMMNDKQGQIACLAMMPGRRTIIGAFQQVDTRFVYDLKDSKLLFAPESCTKDTIQVV
ncbi:hypothetical protein ACP4OV_020867 [Aristida adscensionis]